MTLKDRGHNMLLFIILQIWGWVGGGGVIGLVLFFEESGDVEFLWFHVRKGWIQRFMSSICHKQSLVSSEPRRHVKTCWTNWFYCLAAHSGIPRLYNANVCVASRFINKKKCPFILFFCFLEKQGLRN